MYEKNLSAKSEPMNYEATDLNDGAQLDFHKSQLRSAEEAKGLAKAAAAMDAMAQPEKIKSPEEMLPHEQIAYITSLSVRMRQQRLRQDHVDLAA